VYHRALRLGNLSLDKRKLSVDIVAERRIVELTLEPGASVALVARAHGVNANQVQVATGLQRGDPSTQSKP
jgi:hypothetical protein